MLIDWTGEFDTWLDRLSNQAREGDERALQQLAKVNAAFQVLTNLAATPTTDTPTLRRVRQSKQNPVWRIGHPFTPDIAIRLIVWFPPTRPGEAVVVLFGADKARMGDVFYDSVGTRADIAITRYRMQTEGENP